MLLQILYSKKFRIALIISFSIFFFSSLYYGFSSPEQTINYNDINAYFTLIKDLESGVEGALKHAVSEFLLPSGHRVKLTIDPEFQVVANNIFVKYDLPIGSFVALEPESGRVIAMAGYSTENGLSIKPNLLAQYPAASLVKIITASAAIEDLNFSPGTKISYRSGLYRVSRLDLKTPESNRYPMMTLMEAIAKSANNVFGKLTAIYVGRERLVKYLDKFCFSKTIPFDLTIEKSSALVPEKDLELARTGAGLGKLMISPIHAAMIGSSVANNGLMMRPYMIESIRDKRGNYLYVAQKQFLAETIRRDTARKLIKMMEKTPILGTMRKAFSKRIWRNFVKKFDFAGKTGSITWGPPRIHYEWTLGIAPVNDPSICFVSLTGNTDLWHIKSTYIAREALAKFFKYDYKKSLKKNKKKKRRYKKRKKKI